MAFSEEEYQKLNIEVEKGTRGGDTYWVDGFPYCLRPKKGVYCANKAGKGTDHVGQGACKFHGGNSGRPPTTGRHAVMAKREMEKQYDEMVRDPRMFDILPHLSLQKQLLGKAIDTYEKNPSEDNLHLVRTLNNDIFVGTEKAKKIGSEYAISALQMKSILSRSVMIFKSFIRQWTPDDDEYEDRLESFLLEWKKEIDLEFG